MIAADEQTIPRPPKLSGERRARLEEKLRARQNRPRAAAIPRRSSRGPAPLSFAQQRLWFFDQLEPGSALYNLPTALRLRGNLNVAALQKAIDAIVARHESLRTRFVAEDGCPMQIVTESAAQELPVTELASRPDDLQRRLDEEARRPFDLSRGGLVRARLFRLGDTEHVLLIVMHHIVSDAWSLDVFFRELSGFYEAFRGGKKFLPPELPIQYADFAAWQREFLRGDVLEKQLAFWKNHLAGAPQFLELPADKRRPTAPSFRGAHVERLLPQALAGDLRRLGQAEGATFFMTLLAAFQVLLQRHTRQAEFIVGAPVAGRTRLETEPLIGFFVNTLALRADVSGNPPFRELLARVKQTALDALGHQELPFEKLVEELQPARGAGHAPLVQAMFVLQTDAARELKLPDLSVEPMPVDTGTAKFDLTLGAAEWPDGLFVQIEYNTDLFHEATMARLLGRFQTLLEGIAANPARRVGELPLLTETERRQILGEWSGVKTNYPRNQTIPQLFAEQAAKTPDAVAVVFGEAQLTYRELDRRANQLARRLRNLGVTDKSLVAVCLERSAELIVALLGILKAGSAYVSLEPNAPAARLAFLLRETRAPVLLTQQSLRDHFKFEIPNLQLLCVDEPRETLDLGCSALPVEGSPLHPAYVCFTSGSTGRPKGVIVPHRAVARLVKETNYAHFGADETFLQLAPVAFDASTFEIWGALLNGGKLVIFPPRTPTLAELGAFIREQKITTLWLTAGLFQQMVEEQLENLRGVRQLLAGGDVLSPAHVKRALEHLPNTKIINGYGPTENTTFTCCHEISPADCDGRSISIGRPIANTQVFILDDGGQPTPIGVPGELLAGGDGLALGYLNQPELTAEKFVANPLDDENETGSTAAPAAVRRAHTPNPDAVKFGNQSQSALLPAGDETIGGGARGGRALLYKTGDWARWLPDGTVEFLGRRDSQIKIRGFRVEPGEIEAALNEHPAVRECAVAVFGEPAGDKRLVAYVVAKNGEHRTSDIQHPTPNHPAPQPSDHATTQIPNGELRDFLKTKLPDYMLPAAFVFLEQLPLNANGKMDRRALPPPSAPATRMSAKPVAPPRDETEARLTKIWEDVLGVSPIGVEDHFFDLGGHSLLAVRLAARIEKVFGRRIPVAAVFESPTVAQMARALREGRRTDAVSSLVEIQPRGTKPPLFFVHGVGGGMFWGYTNLARHLGADQPVFAFNSRGMNGQEELATIEELAAQYIADLRAFQPRGPYCLGGYCFGGNVAYEMARQLETQGEPVALLALINCAPPNSSYARFRPTPVALFKFLKNLVHWTGYLRQMDPRQRRDFFHWKIRASKKRWQRLLHRTRFRAATPNVDEVVDLSAQPEDRRRLWEAHVRALLAYHTKPYAGRVTLFRTRAHSLFCSFDDAFGWRDYAASVTVRIVPGAHESVLDEPHVRTLAEALKPCLSETQTGQPGENAI